MSRMNYNGQPVNPAFNYARNVEKAVASLKGILEGITADRQLNEHEANYLLEWTQEHAHLGGDFIDVYEEVKKVLSDGIVSSEERADLLQMLDDCIQYGKSSEECTWRVNQFMGLLKGISADGVVNHSEFRTLLERLSRNADLVCEFPVNLIATEINRILNDGKVTDEELQQLYDVITKTTGVNFVEEGNVIGGSIALFNHPIDFDLEGLQVSSLWGHEPNYKPWHFAEG